MRHLTPLFVILALGATPHGAAAAETKKADEARNVALNDDDRELLVESCHRITYMLLATEQVSQRLNDAVAKDLLGVIKKDADAMHRELLALMKDKGIATPMLEKDYQEDLTELAEAGKDKIYATYRDHQREVTEDLAEALEEAAKDAKHPDVRAFALKWQPSVRHHNAILEKYEPAQ